MAVSASGEYIGSLSGGCIEKAIVSEAIQAIAAGKPKQVAFGAGSPFIDIRLPCGGRVDLLLSPIRDTNLASELLTASTSREEWSLALQSKNGRVEIGKPHQTGWQDNQFIVHQAPAPRLMIAGHGASVEALVRLAHAMAIACDVVTPDADIINRLERQDSTRRHLLERLSDPLPFAPDEHTGCVFLFHDHDWEARLISEALSSPAFYVGAMGSRKTHEARREALSALGVSCEDIARLDAPIGLIPSSRDPETLAISILAQVVERYNDLVAQSSGAPR